MSDRKTCPVLTACDIVDGMRIGVLDRDGTPVRIGDTLSFDAREWGSDKDHEFVVRFEGGGILVDGTVGDIPIWCRVVRNPSGDRFPDPAREEASHE